MKDPLFAVREILPVQRELGIDLLILGEPYDEELAHRLKHPWVTIGQVPYEHMSAAYKQADLVLNTSRAEGQSNAVIEALSIRARILVADIRGNEIVPDPWRFPKREGELTKRLKTVFGKEPCIVPLPSADEEACSYMDVYRSVSAPG